MHVTRCLIRIGASSLGLLVVSGCDGGAPVEPEGTGRLTIVTSTTGLRVGSSEYVVRTLPLGRTDPIGYDDTLHIDGLAPGSYDVSLTGVAGHCPVPDGWSHRVSVSSGAETAVAFAVECSEVGWALHRFTGIIGRMIIAFPDRTTGFAARRGPATPVFRTSDGGLSWTLVATLPSPYDIASLVYFHDAQLGFIGGEHFTLYRTRDGGSTWDERKLGDSWRWVLAMHFVDAQNGWAGGGGGFLFRTRDGGDSWEPVENPFDMPIFGIFFADTLTGVLSGSDGKIVRTTDGGRSWTSSPSSTSEHLQGMAFVNDTVGVAVGLNGAIVRTTNGGRSWSPVAGAGREDLWRVAFGRDGFGVIAGDGGIYVSRDLGASWQREYQGSSSTIRLSVIDEQHAWAGGQSLVLRRVTAAAP
jgi:photosystem II stability/assembly factor-like uncharacterized protein